MLKVDKPFKKLSKQEQFKIYRQMEWDRLNLHNRYTDDDRLKRQCKRHTNNALASYFALCYYKNRFERTKALGERETAPENWQENADQIIEQTSYCVTNENTSSDQQFEYSVNSKFKPSIHTDNGKNWNQTNFDY